MSCYFQVNNCCNMLFPQIRRQLTDKIKEEQQQAIEGKDNQITSP